MKVTMTQTKMPVMDMNEITTEFTLTQDGRPAGYFTIKGIRILCRVYVGINLAGRVFQANDVVSFGHNEVEEYRPLYILEDNVQKGIVYSSTIKTGAFSSKSHTLCAIDGVDYITYFNQIDDSLVGSVYVFEKQVAQFRHSHHSLDEPHIYELACTDDASFTACALTALRNYIIVYLKPRRNEFATKRVTWGYTVPEWPEKYDPDFENKV